MARITRDEMLMGMAHIASLRGTCRLLMVGAVLSFEARPISVGYNGTPSRAPHCGAHCDEGSPCLKTIHAEDNAIRWARAFGVGLKGATLHVTDTPCIKCAQLIVEAGISRVVYDRSYRDDSGLQLLKKHGLEIDRCHIENVQSAICANLPITPASKG